MAVWKKSLRGKSRETREHGEKWTEETTVVMAFQLSLRWCKASFQRSVLTTDMLDHAVPVQ